MYFPSSSTFRKHARSKTRKRVRLTDADESAIDAITCDISESGLSIDTSELGEQVSLLSPGKSFMVDFYALKRFPKRIGAKVVRSTDKEAGLVFD